MKKRTILIICCAIFFLSPMVTSCDLSKPISAYSKNGTITSKLSTSSNNSSSTLQPFSSVTPEFTSTQAMIN
jgi:hypothetical protein